MIKSKPRTYHLYIPIPNFYMLQKIGVFWELDEIDALDRLLRDRGNLPTANVLYTLQDIPRKLGHIYIRLLLSSPDRATVYRMYSDQPKTSALRMRRYLLQLIREEYAQIKNQLSLEP